MEHTPGPWKVEQYSNYLGFSVWAKGVGCIAERWWVKEQPGIPIEANAHLIASAPDLLAACKASADTFADLKRALRLLRHDTIAEAMAIAEASIRETISKAEGRQKG